MIGGPENIEYYPCGQCLACTVNRRRVWTARQLLEADGKTGYFVTLTYNDEHLPGEVEKEEIQKFMKRIRKNTGQKFRYFACAEYGDKYGRPHFHLNLFGYRPSLHTILTKQNGAYKEILQCKNITKAWQGRGFHTLDLFTPNRAAYVANYVTKKMNKSLPAVKGIQEDAPQKHPEFALMSRMPGLGAETFLHYCTSKPMTHWAAENPEVAEVPRAYTHNGKHWPVGSYLRQYVHDRTGLPLMAQRPVHVIVGQEKLKQRFEDKEMASDREYIAEHKARLVREQKRRTAHV